MAGPETLLQLQNGEKAYGSRVLFENATFAINEGEHVGVIGPNGAGKSTLFKALLGQEPLDRGTVTRSQRLRLGYLSQHDHWEPGETGNSYLERVTQLPIWETKSRGKVLQLNERLLDTPVLSLSGGYRMRIKLMGLLGQDPNLMLLDEPTNYLDLETTLLLEKFLQGYEGAFLLISHDREFLRRTTDHILEIEGGEVTKFGGNIDDYFELKQMIRTQIEARAQSLAEKRASILDFVARFGAKATKARQAQSRLKTLAKMESVDVKPLPVSATIRIPPPSKTGKLALQIEGAAFGYGERRVLSDMSLVISRGDHVGVLGLNGAGKSTLLKGLSGVLQPQAGTVKRGFGVELALFAQHVVEELNPADTVYQSMERAAHSELLPQDILDLAGSLLFSGDDVRKKVSVLSGGEKSRVALARVLLKKAPCLILDEPTNHLDFNTVEALTRALQDYEGTVVVVSHDRGFTGRVATKILEVDGGHVRLYPGTYDEYVWNLERTLHAQEEESVEQAPKAGASKSAGAESWEKKKEAERRARAVQKRIGEIEKRMATLHGEVTELNARLAESTEHKPEWVDEMSKKGAELNSLEGEWMQLAEEKERG